MVKNAESTFLSRSLSVSLMMVLMATVSLFFCEYMKPLVETQKRKINMRMFKDIKLKYKNSGNDHDHNYDKILPEVDEIRRIFFPAFFKTHFAYHFASGNIRGSVCISESINPKCSVCNPFLPPVCINAVSGFLRVAFANNSSICFSHLV